MTFELRSFYFLYKDQPLFVKRLCPCQGNQIHVIALQVEPVWLNAFYVRHWIEDVDINENNPASYRHISLKKYIVGEKNKGRLRRFKLQ